MDNQSCLAIITNNNCENMMKCEIYISDYKASPGSYRQEEEPKSEDFRPLRGMHRMAKNDTFDT